MVVHVDVKKFLKLLVESRSDHDQIERRGDQISAGQLDRASDEARRI